MKFATLLLALLLAAGMVYPVAAEKVQSVAAVKLAPGGERRVALVIGNNAGNKLDGGIGLDWIEGRITTPEGAAQRATRLLAEGEAAPLLAEGEASPKRRERSERLFAWLDREGADAAVLEALLAEPLAKGLRSRLAGLPRRA